MRLSGVGFRQTSGMEGATGPPRHVSSDCPALAQTGGWSTALRPSLKLGETSSTHALPSQWCFLKNLTETERGLGADAEDGALWAHGASRV